ncbi:MAG: Crp/Fnr family transcriptional regulator [Polyangiaceae bacterium]|nr:Crp/Fnr family transcriptional regulator [Polyangiaceae bacterium]
MSDTPAARLGREFLPGDVLFREGELGEVMYVIQSGAVRISKNVGGQDKLLAILGPGEFFGEMALLNGKPRTATATVMDPTRCLVIDSRKLEEMVAKNAEISLRLIKKLAKRLDSADSLIEVLLHRDPKARVLLALARHAEAFGEECELGLRVRTTTREIANEVAVDERLAFDTMKRIHRLGIAEERGDSIIVTELSRLRDFLEFLETPRPSDQSVPPANPSTPSSQGSDPSSHGSRG